MLSREANDRLTRIGPGTPMGNLIRRYWHPVATLADLAAEPVLPVKLLGENLALFRSPNGEMGLVAERCPHRGASMVYGIPEDGGLRCPYHGWKFSDDGACLEQPAEPENSTFKHRVRIPAYPVKELGGLIWAYLGPAPVPELPRYDLFVRDDLKREIGFTILPCNWLQAMENSLDPIHLEWLHLTYKNYVARRLGKPETAKPRRHARIAFDAFELGIKKRRLWEGEDEESDDWQIGHPILFPNILSVGAPPVSIPQFQIRVPMDDTTTLHWWYYTRSREPGEPEQTEIPVYEIPHSDQNGRFMVETVSGQDMMVWITQGEISDRTTERLGWSDKGIIFYRSMLMEQMERVARGEDPLGVIRDPAANCPMLEIPRERRVNHVSRAPGDVLVIKSSGEVTRI
jgi:5,5'-dehydrodivanillate O-demethylase oxygenase subunit